MVIEARLIPFREQMAVSQGPSAGKDMQRKDHQAKQLGIDLKVG